MTRVLLIGIAVQDFVFSLDTIPTTPEKHRAKDVAIVGGGLAANAAVAVAKLGGEARLIARLGDDVIGRDIRRDLETEGVDCALVRSFAGHRSPVSSVFVDNAGERLVVNYADPDMPISTDWLPRSLPAGADAVMADSRWTAGSLHLLKLARAAGVPGVLDLDRATGDPKLLHEASHVAMSLQAMRELTETSEPVAGLQMLAERFSTWLAVTDGPRGVWFTDGGTIQHQAGFSVRAIDTLAAGDVFHGAFALGLGEGMAAPQALRFASATAAIKCTRFGGRAGTPSRTEVNTFLAEQLEITS